MTSHTVGCCEWYRALNETPSVRPLRFEADILMLIHSAEGIKEACLYSDGRWNIFRRPSTTASLESGFSVIVLNQVL